MPSYRWVVVLGTGMFLDRYLLVVYMLWVRGRRSCLRAGRWLSTGEPLVQRPRPLGASLTTASNFTSIFNNLVGTPHFFFRSGRFFFLLQKDKKKDCIKQISFLILLLGRVLLHNGFVSAECTTSSGKKKYLP